MAATASVPLLSDVDGPTNNREEEASEVATAGEEKDEARKESKKKPLIKAEYKIAFSHFLVSSD
jgi:hypothetical protein